MSDNIIIDVQKLFKYLNTIKKKHKKKLGRYDKTKSWFTKEIYK